MLKIFLRLRDDSVFIFFIFGPLPLEKHLWVGLLSVSCQWVV